MGREINEKSVSRLGKSVGDVSLFYSTIYLACKQRIKNK